MECVKENRNFLLDLVNKSASSAKFRLLLASDSEIIILLELINNHFILQLIPFDIDKQLEGWLKANLN